MQFRYKGFFIRKCQEQWWVINTFHELVECGFKSADEAKRWIDANRY